MFYGSNLWDPVLIIAQIISVQCLFYISLGLLQVLTIGPTLGFITVAYIFDWSTLHFSTKLGLLNWIAHVVNAIAGAAALAWLVERAKKCLDFAATCYIWHTVFVCGYSGWPQSFAWWLANGMGMLIMVLLGEWLCVRREMQDIPLSIPQRLSSGLLSRRKESGHVVVPMMPLPTDDPDQPPRPRLRTGLTTQQRSSAAAAAASSVAASSSSFNSSAPGPAVVAAASPAPMAPGTARPGSAVQMSPLQTPGAANCTRDSLQQTGGSRKKLLARPASQTNMGMVRLPPQPAMGAPNSAVTPPSAAPAAAVVGTSEVEPA